MEGAAAVHTARCYNLPIIEIRVASNLAMADLAAAHGALYLDRFDFMCEVEAARCLAVGDDLTKHFYDEHHTTMPGAAFFGRRMAETGWLDPVFEALAP